MNYIHSLIQSNELVCSIVSDEYELHTVSDTVKNVQQISQFVLCTSCTLF